MGKTRVAVLGGGPGAMAAAYELSKQPERFEVTVYQPGWRLGGKCASGRNASRGGRIEERGFHVLFGFYAQTFQLLSDVYLALDRDLGKELLGQDRLVMCEREGNGWSQQSITFPRRGADPWAPLPQAASPRLDEIVNTVTRWGAGLQNLPPRVVSGDAVGRRPGLPGAVDDAASPSDLRRDLPNKLKVLREFLNELEPAISRERSPAQLRVWFTSLDVFAATLDGALNPDVRANGLDPLDDLDWVEWLTRHGLTRLSRGQEYRERAPLLRLLYGLGFAFENGDQERPLAAAAVATRALMQIVFNYSGHLYYKFRGGMGDVVFAPLYELLHRNGVQFRFFHAVTGLHSSDGARVDAVDVVPQVGVKGDVRYRPLVDVRGRLCWPNQPRWEQLEDGDIRQHDFEVEPNPLSRPAERLHADKDFDAVVLGISVGALVEHEICAGLAGVNGAFRDMLASARTAPTQHFQLWLRETLADLGSDYQQALLATYEEPVSATCDTSDLIARELWDAGTVKGSASFDGVFELRPGETPAAADQRAKGQALRMLSDHIEPLWPHAVKSRPTGQPLMHDVLRTPAATATLAESLDAQYCRANATPSERCVLSPPGLVRKRLAPDGSGFANLMLAGDWTATELNVGCVEAAVMSGRSAAAALIAMAEGSP